MLPNGKKVIYHFGSWHGFNAAFARLTDEKVTIIILGNRYNRHIYEKRIWPMISSATICKASQYKDDDDR